MNLEKIIMIFVIINIFFILKKKKKENFTMNISNNDLKNIYDIQSFKSSINDTVNSLLFTDNQKQNINYIHDYWIRKSNNKIIFYDPQDDLVKRSGDLRLVAQNINSNLSELIDKYSFKKEVKPVPAVKVRLASRHNERPVHGRPKTNIGLQCVKNCGPIKAREEQPVLLEQPV